MHDQPRYKPLAKSDFFADERSARPLVEGTVARGQLREDDAALHGQGRATASWPTVPVPGRRWRCCSAASERYDIYCTPCHGRPGAATAWSCSAATAARRPSTIDRLRAQPDGYFFDVITNGFGAMPDYAAQVPVADRWAIVAYIRALQLSQNATLADVPAGPARRLERGAGARAGAPGWTRRARPAPSPRRWTALQRGAALVAGGGRPRAARSARFLDAGPVLPLLPVRLPLLVGHRARLPVASLMIHHLTGGCWGAGHPAAARGGHAHAALRWRSLFLPLALRPAAPLRLGAAARPRSDAILAAQARST